MKEPRAKSVGESLVWREKSATGDEGMNDSLGKDGGTKNDFAFGTIGEKREHDGNSRKSKEGQRKRKDKA